jgi:hypothetical protein
MDLGVGRIEKIRALAEREEYFNRWIEHPASAIVHHDSACCEEARLWFLAYARSMEIGRLSDVNIKAPVWLSDLFKWGPSEWPIAWCELVKEKVLDCGVFAALAREVFKAQGHEVHPAQALLSYNETCTGHWKELWSMKEELEKKRAGDVFPWIGDNLVYHELCVLEQADGQAKFYDSTWGTWLAPQSRAGFGALLALRTECPRLLQWGGRSFSCGEWVNI